MEYKMKNKIKQNTLELHIMVTYGEYLSTREITRLTEDGYQKDFLKSNLIQKEKYFKLLKHNYRELFPTDNERMLKVLESYQKEREVHKRQLHRAVKDVKIFVETIESAIARFDYSNRSYAYTPQKGFTEIIREFLHQDILDSLYSFNYNDFSINNLKKICLITKTVLDYVTDENLETFKENDNNADFKIKIFKRVHAKVTNALEGVKAELGNIEELSLMVSAPMQKEEACKSCNGKGFVKDYPDNQFEVYSSRTESLIYRKCTVCNH